ncbi:hypothetical protein SAMN05216516_101494 [Izhakiella capsodis]|uniref:YnhF family membrane protein n=1 Tax=Izhakiella capsodis TaxID=1367852 RepID=A0A1I4V1T3_9GAMM|nr:YnhF family membrane protein [Izhakiella capsodis]SFM95158.1 hypothetical protein SAMN05216516_101494 [Izhakiella capsodis]
MSTDLKMALLTTVCALTMIVTFGLTAAMH